MFDEQIDPCCTPVIIHGDERIDDLQLGGLRILQKTNGFRFGMDAVLLADFARVGPRDHVADFGTGTGILPLLLAGRSHGERFDALEIQPHMADMAMRSVRLNGLEERITVHHVSVEHADSVIEPGTLDVIVCNPPYGVAGATLINPSSTLSTARHQTEAGLTAWYRMAYKLLRGKGRFTMIYPAPRMLEAMQALSKARLEPKRFRLIYPYADKPANLVLIEAMKDAKPMLHPEPPLVVYEQDGSMTAELKKIYHITD
ncbi:MAG: tRNA1(Val) (adenine(37)-N6)-methyltransferase [Clostridia bacterium]|nr:tRNA1(Val) (adenine(37)-N6)-methyltransferase [Clostridia bacterium]